ncbi:Phosphoesterase [plant metagenome]|uniref:Phosphoesterase n=1 Tax=plant metagenome TaxID=1297885 RepID=A0A484QM45_9ZZZZ
MFHLYAGIIALYVILRFVRLLPWGRTAKVLLSALIVVGAEHHLVTRNIFGSMASPEVPGWLLMGLGWATGTLVLFGLFLILSDLLGCLLRRVAPRPSRLLLAPSGWRCGLLVLAVCLGALGVREAVRVPPVKTVEVAIPGWPQALDGLRVAQLTDLHASRLLDAPWMEQVVARTNALKADLIVITGDMVDGSPAARVADVKPLQDLAAPLGVLAIPGNHEYYVDYLGWVDAFQKTGLRLLRNEHVTLTHAGQRFVVAGLTDRVAERIAETMPDLAGALAGRDPADPVILLDHRPATRRKPRRPACRCSCPVTRMAARSWGPTAWRNG